MGLKESQQHGKYRRTAPKMNPAIFASTKARTENKNRGVIASSMSPHCLHCPWKDAMGMYTDTQAEARIHRGRSRMPMVAKVGQRRCRYFPCCCDSFRPTVVCGHHLFVFRDLYSTVRRSCVTWNVVFQFPIVNMSGGEIFLATPRRGESQFEPS